MRHTDSTRIVLGTLAASASSLVLVPVLVPYVPSACLHVRFAMTPLLTFSYDTRTCKAYRFDIQVLQTRRTPLAQ